MQLGIVILLEMLLWFADSDLLMTEKKEKLGKNLKFTQYNVISAQICAKFIDKYTCCVQVRFI